MSAQAPTPWAYWSSGFLTCLVVIGIINQASQQHWWQVGALLAMMGGLAFGLWTVVRRARQPEPPPTPWYKFRH